VTLAVRRPVVDAYVAAAAGAGLQVVNVTAEPEALLASLALAGPDSRTMRLVVDLGLGSTRIYAGIGRRLMFARQLKTGGRHLERAVSEALGVGAGESCALRSQLPPLDRGEPVSDARLRKVDEACQETIFRLVMEIRMCLHYLASVFGHTPVHHMVFVGGGAKYRRLCQRVASGVGLPARAADPLARLARRPGEQPGEGGPVWATAVGLAVQGAAAAAAPGDSPAWDDDDTALGRVSLAV
jgi:Tfp pilus assembly PilM family ATPase